MPSKQVSLACLLAGYIALSNVPHAAGQVQVLFNVPGPADWNSPSSWNPANIPVADFNEVAVINGARSAFVQDTPPDVGRIGIDDGSLEIRPGGTLTAKAVDLVNGALQVGNGTGVGNLTIRRGGTLNAGSILLLGGATSRITLGETGGSGTANLAVTGGTLARTTRIVGPNVSFTSSGTLIFGSSNVLNPVITGTTHSTIQVTGLASFGGIVRPEFVGYTPGLGNSWDLVTATSLNDVFTVDASLAPPVPLGARFIVTKSATTATLRYTNALVLTVNRGTGGVQIRNVIGDPIAFEGYTIGSASGALAGSWNSLQDQGLPNWDEADNSTANRRTEFKTAGSTSLAVGASQSLGALFAPSPPAAFGDPVGTDLSFEYAVPGAGTQRGIIEYVGGENNLVLTINPATGEAAIQNESPFFNVAIDAYTITSTSGKLLTGDAAWNSLQDQALPNWDQADNSSVNRITEFKTAGATSLPGNGAVLDLGDPISTSSGPLSVSDFGLSFKLSTGQVLNGIIRFGEIPVAPLAGGDYDDDGDVDGNDFLRWQRTLGTNVTPGTGSDGSGNGVVDAADLAVWRTNFGSTGLGVPATTPVPEPAPWLLVGAAAVGLLPSVRRRRGVAGVQ